MPYTYSQTQLELLAPLGITSHNCYLQTCCSSNATVVLRIHGDHVIATSSQSQNGMVQRTVLLKPSSQRCQLSSCGAMYPETVWLDDCPVLPSRWAIRLLQYTKSDYDTCSCGLGGKNNSVKTAWTSASRRVAERNIPSLYEGMAGRTHRGCSSSQSWTRQSCHCVRSNTQALCMEVRIGSSC
jgi:hypothetical protein